ncbi:MAG TPA: VWA domain-containing protein [Candidatus Limnocylindrales bacterium]|nr:VWA domain-containing protein [Candidatus Limnocylindrales bacterium]
MGLRFETPLWLLLLVPALLITFIPYLAARRRIGAGRRRAAVGIRTLLLSALVLALAGFQLVLPVDRLATVFVVDLSDSVGEAGRENALAFLRETLDVMPEGDQAGIVAFGKDALVERLPEEVRDIDRLRSAPVQGATDIGEALRLASALFPDASQKRIVLVSDGNDTTGRGQREAALAAARGIQIETKVIGLVDRDEVLVDRLTTPSTAKIHEQIDAVADITSSVAQPATVRLFMNGAQVGVQRVDLKPGANRVTFSCPNAVDPCALRLDSPGFIIFRATVEAAQDTFSQNDRADSNTIVKGVPKILVLPGNEAVGAELVAALEQEGQVVDTLVPEAISENPVDLLDYDSIVVVDVPRIRFNDKQLLAMQAYVQTLGRGLVMIGGPNAYGAGGYTKTPMEELLPVDMGVRNRQKEPDIALVVVIDKSGSMDACHCNSFNGGQGGGGQLQGVRKVDIGKEAILRAAAALSAKDELGVVAFDDSAHWVVQTQPLGNVTDLEGAIGGIQPLGTTNIFAGLTQAVDSLEKVSATRRHIILLTDGWSRSGEYTDILAKMKADGITLSTVGAGGGANPFLQDLATQGGGRFYAATNPASIPDIFLKETQQVAGQQIVEEPFFPIQTSDSPIIHGLEDGLPRLLGYDGTTLKSAAQQVLVSTRDDPILAQWQYGLGRSVAWTSDSTGRWAKNWVGWSGFTRFFSQLVSWTFPGEETAGIEARFETLDGRTRLHVESVEADGSPRDFYQTFASVVGPDLAAHDVTLDQVAPGVYEQDLGEIDSGAYAIRITQTRSGAAPLGRTVGLVEPVAAEYRILGVNVPFLAALRSATGGKEVVLATDPWVHDLKLTSSFTELWPWLLVLALLLWPLDVALRRVSLGRRELRDARAWAGRRWRGRGAAAPRTAAGEGMLAARERAAGSSARAALLRRPEETRPTAPAAGAPAAVKEIRPAGSGPAPRPVDAPAASAAAAPSSTTSPTAASAAGASPASTEAEPMDTLARLREAKKRARGG